VGCDAWRTLDKANLPGQPHKDLSRNIWIWKGPNGVYVSDGKAPIPIHDDIKNYFDPTKDEYILPALASSCVGRIDVAKMWYRLLVPSGVSATGLNQELIFDLQLWRWFRVDRKANQLVELVNVAGSNGLTYQYGFLDTGYMERLNNGLDFDGVDIEHTMGLPDIVIEDSMGFPMITQVKAVGLVMVAHKTNTNLVSYTHYTDSILAGLTAKTLSPHSTTKRLINELMKFDEGPRGSFHSGKFVITTDTEKCGFEPLAVVYYYSDEFENKGG